MFYRILNGWNVEIKTKLHANKDKLEYIILLKKFCVYTSKSINYAVLTVKEICVIK